MLRKYPAIPVLVAVVAGILVGDLTDVPSWLFLSASLTLILLSLAFFSREKISIAVLLAIGSAGTLSGFHYQIRHVERGPHHAANVLSSREVVRLFGEIADWPDLRRDHTDYVVELDSVESDRMRHVEGRLILRVTDTSTALQRGDRIECFGRVYLADPNAAKHSPVVRRMALREICGTVYLPTLLNVRVDRRPIVGLFSLVDRTRTWILQAFERNLSAPAAALAGGFLLGETRHISTDVYSLFRDSGTLHVLAVSGSNVALVLLFVLLLLRPFGVRQPWRGVILLAVVFLFALLSYSQPSVIRASIMAAFIIIAGMLGREYDLNHIVSLTVLTILAAAPAQLFDIGFQLSVVTAWGLVLLVKPTTALFSRWHNRWWYRWLVFPSIVSVIAQLCSAPLIAYHFGVVPLATVPANLVVVPLTSLAVVALLALLVGHFILPLLGLFIGSLVNPILILLIKTLELFGSLHLPTLNTGPLSHQPFSELSILLYFGFIISVIFGLTRRPLRKWALGIALFALNVFLCSEILLNRNRPAQINFSSLPGGIVALVDQPGLESADLIVAPGWTRIDNLDARLLQPLLDMHRVKKIRYLFVLSAPFDNIDDLLRLAAASQSAGVYVASSHRASFEDFLVYHPEYAPPPITYFGGLGPGPASNGYHLSETGIALKTENRLYLFGPPDETFDSQLIAARVDDVTLVLTSRWAPAASDWIALKEMGITRIVCSRIEQRRNEFDEGTPVDEADLVLPEYTIDLYRSGPYRLPL